jgi:type II secretory pathway pseudopilin PulG
MKITNNQITITKMKAEIRTVQGSRSKVQGFNIERCSKGFTSIELIVVIICLAILTFTIGVSFNRTEMGSAVAADQLIADIRYVQLRAMSVGVQQSLIFTLNSGNYIAAGENKTLPQDILVTGTNIGNTVAFNTIGEPTFGSGDGTITLSSGGAPVATINIHGITGRAE